MGKRSAGCLFFVVQLASGGACALLCGVGDGSCLLEKSEKAMVNSAFVGISLFVGFSFGGTSRFLMDESMERLFC